MLVSVPDDLAEVYHAHAAQATQPFGTVVVRQLTRFKDLSPSEAVVVLRRDDQERLEQLLGGGTLKSATDLIARTQEYASVRLGNIQLPLTASQKAEIVHRAEKQGKTPHQLTQEMVDYVLAQLFDAVPVAR